VISVSDKRSTVTNNLLSQVFVPLSCANGWPSGWLTAFSSTSKHATLHQLLY